MTEDHFSCAMGSNSNFTHYSFLLLWWVHSMSGVASALRYRYRQQR